MSNFKEMAAVAKRCSASVASYGNDELSKKAGEIAYFLQSLATLSEGEPDPGYLVMLDRVGHGKQTNYVLQTYADWWRTKCIAMQAGSWEQKDFKDQLAAANARIKELEDSLCDKMTADNQAMGLYDPPRPLLADQSEVFDELVYAIRHADDMTSVEWLDCKEQLRKLLVGE